MLVDDVDAHVAGGAGHYAHGGFDVGGVEVGHFLRRHFAQLGFGDLAYLLGVGGAGAGFDADGFL